MKFFNPKEDVIDLQITQYGKYLLSKGKFNPVYYAFYDDDILYDPAGNGEVQNASEPRIQEDTPRLRTQYVFSGRESRIQEHTEHYARDVEHILSARSEFTMADRERWAVQPSVDNNHSTMLPLGTAELSVRNVPAWALTLHKGEIYDVRTSITGALTTINIPQVDVELEYEFSVGTDVANASPIDLDLGADDDYPGAPGVEQDVYLNGTFIKVEEDFVVLEIEEKNSVFESSNFEVQVFEINQIEDLSIPGEVREELIPLGFVVELSEGEGFANVDSGFVEHYFDIFVDQEIDDRLLCKLKGSDRKKGLYADRIIECPDEIVEKTSIYRRTVLDEDFEEPCE